MANSKKTPASNKSTQKKKTAKKKTSVKKGKVYIAPYKIIVLCALIIIVCMILLLATTFAGSTATKKEASTITERFEKKAPEETKNLKSPFENSKKQSSSENKEKNTATKDEKNTKEDSKSGDTKKTPAKSTKQTETKNNQTVKTTEKKSDTNKQTQNTKEQSAKQTTTKPAASPAKPAAPKDDETKKNETVNKAPSITETPVIKQTEKKVEQQKFNFPEAKSSAQLIFVFDDGGQNLNHLEKFMALPFPFTVAVLPKLPHSAESAERIRKSGNEVILHQPMQSVNANVNPGPGAIKPDMGEEQIKTILFQNINEISPIMGLNNHEGSAITADADKMAVVLQYATEQGLYFLDSRTNVETKVPYVAKEMGYSYYERNIFLDNEKTRENTLKELNKGLALANKNGSVIMIGHIWSADYLPALLIEAYPELKEKGYTFSVVSKSKAKK